MSASMSRSRRDVAERADVEPGAALQQRHHRIRITVIAPANSPNTDGVDLVGSTNVTLSDLNISVATTISPSSPACRSTPRSEAEGTATDGNSQVQVTNITTATGMAFHRQRGGHGVNNVTIQNVHLLYRERIQIKTAAIAAAYLQHHRGRLGDGRRRPAIDLDAYYRYCGPTEPPYDAAVQSRRPHVRS